MLFRSLETGVRRTVQAEEGFYIQALGFMGTDFIYGGARKEDIVKDITGNYIFPMGYVTIQGENGNVVREFPYEDQNKYIVSIAIENNRISLECIQKTEGGGYTEAVPEPITYNNVEAVEKIALETKSSGVKKRIFYLNLTENHGEAQMQQLAPRQVLFEGSRNLKQIGRAHV